MKQLLSRLGPVFTALLTGASYWFIVEGAALSDPFIFMGMRSVIVGLTLGAIARPSTGTWRSALRVALPLASGLGGLGVALLRGGLIEVAIISAAGFTLSMVGLRILGKRPPRPLELIGFGLAAIAIVVLWADGTQPNVLVPAAIAAVGFAAVVLIAERTPYASTPIPFAAAALTEAGVFLGALGVAAGGTAQWSVSLVAALAAASFFSGVALYLSRVRSIEVLGALSARRVLALEPVGAMVMAYALDVAGTTLELVALSCVVAGVWMTATSGRPSELEITAAGR